MRRGVTLLEVTAVVLLIALISAIATPVILRRLDRSKVRHASSEIVAALGLARTTAVAREGYVSVLVDAARGSITVASGSDTLLTRPIGDIYGVALRSNRDSSTYGPTGLGFGAANQSILVERGGAVDTVVISRLGRVRH